MKAIQIPYRFYPDVPGGTEVYAASLARHLQSRRVDVLIAASAEEDRAYEHEGLRVRRYGEGPLGGMVELFGVDSEKGMRSFRRMLDEEEPDILHFHGFRRGVPIHATREARRRSIPVVLTYHTPVITCKRGTLMRWGTEVCDGILDLDRCTACTLQGAGIPRPFAHTIGRVPVEAGRALGTLPVSHRLLTGLRLRQLMDGYHRAVRDFLAEVDHIVAVCHWGESLLRANGIPAEKLSVSRQGLPQIVDRGELGEQVPASASPLRIAYLGRLNRVKGVDFLVRAVRLVPDLPLEVHIYGVTQDAEGLSYSLRVRRMAGDDGRISFRPPVPSDQVVSLLRGYHLLAVPSQWMETGPLVVLEAFAAGTPVLGSNRGGIAEIVRPGIDGLLIEPASPQAWAGALERFIHEPDLLDRLRAGVRWPRTMAEVADDMLHLYHQLLGRRVVRTS